MKAQASQLCFASSLLGFSNVLEDQPDLCQFSSMFAADYMCHVGLNIAGHSLIVPCE
eukprot:c27445_g1_i1 orf=43-213(+)